MSDPERGESYLSGKIRIGSVLEQKLNDLRVILLGGHVQRGEAHLNKETVKSQPDSELRIRALLRIARNVNQELKIHAS